MELKLELFLSRLKSICKLINVGVFTLITT